MPQDTKVLEERFLSKLLLEPNQVSTTGLQSEDFQDPLGRAAFGAIAEVFHVYGLRKDFLYLVVEAMRRLDVIRSGTVSPHRYLDRISRLETTSERLDCLVAKIKANSPRIRDKDEIADKILTALQNSEGGLSRTSINHLFQGHRTRYRLQQAINFLIANGLVVFTKKRTPGKSVELLFAKEAK